MNRKAIAQAPSEFSRRQNVTDGISPREAALDGMFSTLQSTLHFGSVALLRVDPAENHGMGIVPIVIGRKAPHAWSSNYARDGMFDVGDVMVFIYELDQTTKRPGEFKIPNVLLGDETRAVPLKCLAGPGQGFLGYMETVPRRSRSSTSSTRCRLRPGVAEEGWSNLVRMSVDPMSAFQNMNLEPLLASDHARAPIQPSIFCVGTVIRKGFKAPSWGNERAWSGLKKLDAEVVEIATFETERRHYYRLKWSGESRDLILANVPRDVDEGYIQKYVYAG